MPVNGTESREDAFPARLHDISTFTEVDQFGESKHLRSPPATLSHYLQNPSLL